MPLITAAEARGLIPGLTGTTQDTAIDAFILRAGALMAIWCGFPPATAGVDPTLGSATYTRYYDGDGTAELDLGVYPVVSVTTIHDDPDRGYGAAYLVDAADYEIDKEKGTVFLLPSGAHGVWSNHQRRAVKAVFVAGFETVPESIKQACAQEVKRMMGLRGTQGQTNASRSGASTGYRDEDLLPQTRTLLSPLRLPAAILGGTG